MTKNILLTGCTRGLGRALVDRFIEQGHVVVGCGRASDEIDRLSQTYPFPHNFQRVDVSRADQVEAWSKPLLKNGLVPDIVINNGGVINRNACLWEVPAEEFDQVVDINLKGVANVLREFLPAMVTRRRGVIVNFSSGWGRSASSEVAPYCATKWAIEGLTKSLAQELPAGMAAIPLNPGVINTQLLQSCYGTEANNYPDADQWSYRAASVILSFNESHNGQSLTI
ncbi:MAG: SDR family oxidoreductase [Planctomycetaceae bacterium]|nr:SDR family oxidoreductase [Planctomycetaceae bacterium]